MSGKRCIGYICADLHQDVTENIIQEKKNNIINWVHLNNAVLIDIFVDPYIPEQTYKDRVFLNHIVSKLQAGDLVLVPCYDNLALSIADFVSFSDSVREVGCDLVLLGEQIDNTTARGRFSGNIMAALYDLKMNRSLELDGNLKDGI